MKVVDKILYLQSKVQLNDRNFCKRYKLSYQDFKKIKFENSEPNLTDIKFLINYFDLDFEDFMDPTTTINKDDKTERQCKIKNKNLNTQNIIHEDFAREENSRYEEKD